MKNEKLIAFFERHDIPTAEIEIGMKNNPLEEVLVTFGLFDGFAVGAYLADNGEWYFVKLTYPELSKINIDRELEDQIIDYMFSGWRPDTFSACFNNAAVTFGDTHWITLSQFEEAIKLGLADFGVCPKRLHIFQNEGGFLNALDGKIYGVADSSGKYICDIHEEEYIWLTNAGTLIDSNETLEFETPDHSDADIYLIYETRRLPVYESRIEIIIL